MSKNKLIIVISSFSVLTKINCFKKSTKVVYLLEETKTVNSN